PDSRPASRSIAHRNAASVLPDPVGAEIRTCSPLAIAGQAWACAGVGAVNAPANQSRVRELKCSRATQPSVPIARPATVKSRSIPDRITDFGDSVDVYGTPAPKVRYQDGAGAA